MDRLRSDSFHIKKSHVVIVGVSLFVGGLLVLIILGIVFLVIPSTIGSQTDNTIQSFDGDSFPSSNGELTDFITYPLFGVGSKGKDCGSNPIIGSPCVLKELEQCNKSFFRYEQSSSANGISVKGFMEFRVMGVDEGGFCITESEQKADFGVSGLSEENKEKLERLNYTQVCKVPKIKGVYVREGEDYECTSIYLFG